MYVCMYVCVYIYICIYLFIYIYIYIYIYILRGHSENDSKQRDTKKEKEFPFMKSVLIVLVDNDKSFGTLSNPYLYHEITDQPCQNGIIKVLHFNIALKAKYILRHLHISLKELPL